MGDKCDTRFAASRNFSHFTESVAGASRGSPLFATVQDSRARDCRDRRSSEVQRVSQTLAVISPAVPGSLEPVRLSGREGVNSLFEYELLLKTPDILNFSFGAAADIDLDSFIGNEISCLIELAGAGEFIAGKTAPVCARSTPSSPTRRLWGEEGRHVQYKLTLRPWLHLANAQHRLQDLSEQDRRRDPGRIARRLFVPRRQAPERNLPSAIFRRSSTRVDFAFFERLCQEWGSELSLRSQRRQAPPCAHRQHGRLQAHASAAYQQVEYHAPGWKIDAEYIHSFVPHHQLTSGSTPAATTTTRAPRPI
jgi:type VI secretion system secreted protein VgrG